MPAPRSSDPAATALLDLITSHRITAAIYVAARLGLPDFLAEGPRTSRDLAQRSGADERSVRRLLRALVSLGVCRRVQEDSFELTAIGGYLAGTTQQSLKAWALFEGDMLYRSWESLLDSIRTGKTGGELAGIHDTFGFLAGRPEAAKTFNEAMLAFTRLIITDVLAAYDFSAIARLIDVGGGYGQLLCAILTAYPSIRGAVFDLPHCAEGAHSQLADRGVSSRGEFIPGDFFASVPSGADAIILKSVIHDWNDERSITILTNCRRALPPAGKLLLVERVMPETPTASPEDRSVTLSDLNMLRGPGGCERTAHEYRQLLGRSGFTMARVLPAGRLGVIEATLR